MPVFEVFDALAPLVREEDFDDRAVLPLCPRLEVPRFDFEEAFPRGDRLFVLTVSETRVVPVLVLPERDFFELEVLLPFLPPETFFLPDDLLLLDDLLPRDF